MPARVRGFLKESDMARKPAYYNKLPAKPPKGGKVTGYAGKNGRFASKADYSKWLGRGKGKAPSPRPVAIEQAAARRKRSGKGSSGKKSKGGGGGGG